MNPRPIPSGGSANHTVPVCFSPEYTASANDFDTLRKPGWVADLLHEQPVAGIALVAPALLDPAVLATVHDAACVRAVQTGEPRHLAESSGFHWDAGLWTSVRASNSGAVAARACIDAGAHRVLVLDLAALHRLTVAAAAETAETAGW